MLQSHIIEIDGVFVGAAVRIDRGYRFVAIDFRLEELDSTIWPTLADVQRLARRLYLNGSFASPTTSEPASATHSRAGHREAAR
jgi:hypothetical protein